MSLEYYLYSKKKYEYIISNLNDIIEQYDEIFSYADNLNIKNDEDMLELFQQTINKDKIKLKLICLHQLKNNCQEKIKTLCEHDFVDDTIDINPDKSQNITYCRICEYTLPNP